MKPNRINYMVFVFVIAAAGVMLFQNLLLPGNLQKESFLSFRDFSDSEQIQINASLYHIISDPELPVKYFWSDSTPEEMLYRIITDNDAAAILVGRENETHHYLIGMEAASGNTAYYGFISCGKNRILSPSGGYQTMKSKNFFVISNMEVGVQSASNADPQYLLFPWMLIRESEMKDSYFSSVCYLERNQKYHILDSRSGSVESFVELILDFYRHSGMYEVNSAGNSVTVVLKEDALQNHDRMSLYTDPFNITVGETNESCYIQMN